MKQVIFFSCVIFTSVVYACEHSKAIEQLLPKDDQDVESYTAIEGGMTNNIVLCKTPNNAYIFRYRKKREPNQVHFDHIASLTQKTADLKIHPKIHGINNQEQHMLMDYIPSSPWPSYDANVQPYIATMRALRRFHDAVRPSSIDDTQTIFAPFSAILRDESSLLSHADMPRKHLSIAFDTIRHCNERMAPWLREYATYYHGDFKWDNVVLEKNQRRLRPWIIDLDSSGLGHPFFDVVKITQRLSAAQCAVLFKAYLNRESSPEENLHFHIMRNALRMVVAEIRCKHAISTQKADEMLSPDDMDKLLDSKDPLPLQSTVPMSNPSFKMQQLGAIYALHDFLINRKLLDTQSEGNA